MGMGTDETGSHRTGTVVDGEGMGTDGRESGTDRKGDDDRDGHIPHQGLPAYVTEVGAYFAKDGLHMGLVTGGEHHGVTSVLAAPKHGCPHRPPPPLYAVLGPLPLPSRPAAGPAARRWTPASTAPRSSPQHPLGSGSGLGLGLTSVQAGWSVPSGTG